MKANRLPIVILSVLLLTLSSGLLFYKNLFVLDSPNKEDRLDLVEIRMIDSKINATVMGLRRNLTSDHSIIDEDINHIREQLNIIRDVNKNAKELSHSVNKIQIYFDTKIKTLQTLKNALIELKTSVEALNPSYSELVKNNIKFSLDKRDFYQQCVIDSLMYLTLSTPFYEGRLVEDRKILGQILSFATTPNLHVQNFTNHIDILLKRIKEIESISDGFNKDDSIKNEIAVLEKYYNEVQQTKERDGEIFLTMVFSAIILYLFAIGFVVLRKIT